MTAELAARESGPLSHFDRGGLRPRKWDDTEVIPPKAPWRAMLRRRPISPRVSAAISYLMERYRSRVLTHGLAELPQSHRYGGRWCRRGRRRSERELFFVSLSHHDRRASGTTSSSLFWRALFWQGLFWQGLFWRALFWQRTFLSCLF